MVSQYGIKLAVHLINNHFGNLVAKVCENLLRRGPLTLQLIVRYTELTPQQVKNSLLILIQHNCVQAFSLEQEGGLEDGPRSNTQYMALFNNMLHRMRFSKFLEIVSREFDEECKGLLEGLLQHGRLTLKQMVERAKDMAERAKSTKKEGKSFVKV
ncbi:DNA-directed RNA polymerase III subunit rpc3 [Morella rubra]|uniref:DNA-directed RNA polymerase III subunit RPC3 n=1 Tax=Morella rubra TaxID=262757 RepID=A0A6A1VD45_9ROSI|nr:DNA-directed RNA polymerase III subunit rpc3 [Morella rubra]